MDAISGSQEASMSPRKPWQPRVESEPEFNPFENDTSERGALLDTPQINDPDEDSAPLEGSKDLSDEDSLDDVIADEDEKRPRRP
jgi:hypothetical protein